MNTKIDAMSNIGRMLRLYFWKEEMNNKLGADITDNQIILFKDLDLWIDSIYQRKIEPDLKDILEWESKFREISKYVWDCSYS